MKKISLLLCFVVCILGLSACAPEKPVDEATATVLENMSASIIEGAFAPLDAEQAKQLTDMGPEYLEFVFENAMGMQVNGNGMVSAFDSWTKGIEEIGAYEEITDFDVRYNSKGDGFIVNSAVSCENGTGVVEFTADDIRLERDPVELIPQGALCSVRVLPETRIRNSLTTPSSRKAR